MHRSHGAKFFCIRTKQEKKTLISFYEKASLYAYFGEGAEDYFDCEAITPIGDAFRKVCEDLGVEFSRYRKNTACSFTPKAMSSAPVAKFFELLLDTIFQADAVLADA